MSCNWTIWPIVWFLVSLTAPCGGQRDDDPDAKWDRHIQKMIQDSISDVNAPINRVLPDRVLQTQFFSQRNGWSLVGFGEVPYIATLYSRPGEMKVGKACGGITVTRHRVLTLCACAQYFITYHKGTTGPADTEYDIRSSEIFVSFNQLRFEPDYRRTLVRPDHGVGWCFPTPREGSTTTRWQREMAVLPFSPSIRLSYNNFMPWPSAPLVTPSILNRAYGNELRQYVGTSAYAQVFGMKQVDPGKTYLNDYGLTIDVTGSLVSWELELVEMRRCVDSFRLDSQEMGRNRLLCYKVHGNDLCGNEVPGYPVIRDDKVQGLIINRHFCDGSTDNLMVRAFTPDFAIFLNREVPISQRRFAELERAPLFREGQLDYVSYEIWPEYFSEIQSRGSLSFFKTNPIFILLIIVVSVIFE